VGIWKCVQSRRALACAAALGCFAAGNAGATALAAGGKVVYGTDDRIDRYAETDAFRTAWAASTCAVVSSGRLTPVQDGAAYNLGLAPFRRSGLPPCDGEPFANQQTLANCTAFMVGPDLVATAGHCLNESSMASWRFVFGFAMLDENTIVSQVPADHVYTPVEMVAYALDSGTREDFAIVRVDRAITAPGAVPLEIRRQGVIPNGTPIGVIGHPSGLPIKIAFGENTAVRDNTPANYFVANLDTYGGNSGSPVFNADTGLVEGILVRGEVDYVLDATCFRSNTVDDNAGRGEDVSKTTSFADAVPPLASGLGQLSFNAPAYRCAGSAQITLVDTDLRGAGTATVQITVTGGGSTTLFLPESPPASGRFAGSLALAGLGGQHGALVAATYSDANHGGAPAIVSAVAGLDCQAPVISDIAVGPVFAQLAVITFTTDEPARGGSRWGLDCDSLTETFSSDLSNTSHSVGLVGLAGDTTYQARVFATDAAGNVAEAGLDTACIEVTTPYQRDHFTRQYSSANNLQFRQLVFTPEDSPNGYALCTGPASALPVDPAAHTALELADDDFAEILLDGAELPFYGVAYPGVYVGSNGILTFESGSAAFQVSLENHFAAPRLALWNRDFNPAGTDAVRWAQLPDRLVVTYLAIKEWNTFNQNTMQAELFFDGTLRLTYLAMDTRNGIVGLSEGGGLPAGLTASNFDNYPACPGEAEGEAEGEPEGEGEPDPVIFADPLLRAAVLEALGREDTPLYPADLLPLTALDAAGRGISDLGGLQFALNLAALDVSDNALTSVAPLAALPSLGSLDLAGNSAELDSLQPLLDNAEFGAGDALDLWCARLSDNALGHLAALLSRGVEVAYFYDDACHATAEGETEGAAEGAAEGATEGETEGGGASYHSTDTNLDGRISLSELLRVIQFYNSGGLHCSPGTGDGYAAGPGATDCAPHSADYNPVNWRIALSELLRLIQLYNAGSYAACPGSEDGFCVLS
jgi:hypothetical protein